MNTSAQKLINLNRIFTIHKDVVVGLATYGLSGCVKHIVGRINEVWHEWWLGIRTRGYEIYSSKDIDRQFCNDYAPVNFAIFHKGMRNINIKPGEDVFLDYGSGMGRAVISAAKYPFRKIIGIELFCEPITIAEQNIRQSLSKLKCKDIKLINMNAAKYLPSKEITVFFLFNPFDGPILSSVLKNIQISLIDYPRDICLMYIPAVGVQHTIFDDCKWLFKFRQVRSYCCPNRVITIYKNNQ